MVLELKLPNKPVELNFPDGLSHEEFENLCLANEQLVIERESDGKLNVMAPASFNSSNREAEFITDLKIYARKHGGEAVSSQVGLTLPDQSVRMPDACYITEAQLSLIEKDDLDHFPSLVPVFVVEVLSPSDRLVEAMSKMKDVWLANGVSLGWLVDVDSEKLWIYRQNGTVDLIEGFNQTVSGEDIVPGFEFDLQNLM